MNDGTIILTLTLEESGVMVQALAECPFKLVFELIGKLNHQAQQFYQPSRVAGEGVNFNLSAAELSCCLKALGELPYNRVSLLLSNLQAQLHAQKK